MTVYKLNWKWKTAKYCIGEIENEPLEVVANDYKIENELPTFCDPRIFFCICFGDSKCNIWSH